MATKKQVKIIFFMILMLKLSNFLNLKLVNFFTDINVYWDKFDPKNDIKKMKFRSLGKIGPDFRINF